MLNKTCAECCISTLRLYDGVTHLFQRVKRSNGQPMFALSQRQLSTFGQRVRWGFLGLATAPILGAYSYNQGYRAPLLDCPFLHFTGIPCPTCGMTRSFMAIARGDMLQAIDYNALGPILFVACVVASLQIGLELTYRRPMITPYTQLLGHRSVQLMILLVVLNYYAHRLYLLFKAGILYPSIMRSPLGHLLFSSMSFT